MNPTKSVTDNGLLCIAAFISGGMHENVEQLDLAREALGTGTIELVSAAISYTDYIENLFLAGMVIYGDVPGTMEYEVAEEFGRYYVNEVLNSNPANPTANFVLPPHLETCAKLVELMENFFVRQDGTQNLRDAVHANLLLVELPAEPQI